MNDDPVNLLAKQRIIAASSDIEAQLSVLQGCRPVLVVLLKARDRAAESLEALAFVDANKPDDIRTLQNEVKRYDELVEWFRDIVTTGIEYDKEITAEDQEQMLDLLTQTLDGQQEAIELGLLDPSTHQNNRDA